MTATTSVGVTVTVTVTVDGALDLATDLVGERAGEWDLAGTLPATVLHELGSRGLLCAQTGPEHGGPGWSCLDNGGFTAHLGALDSSLRSVATSHGMAAWTVQRFGGKEQRATVLRRLTSGDLAAIGFSEPDAGSDLAAMRTRVHRDGDTVLLEGAKSWVTAAAYADLLLVVARDGDAAAVVVVPTDAPGVTVERIAAPLGCRAAGHADVRLAGVRLPVSHLLGGGGQPLALLTTTALAYGRMSVAWGCVGILRACRSVAAHHARTRHQSGARLADHQLVARRLADLYTAEQTATRMCADAAACWDDGSPRQATAVVLAKYVAAGNAARGAESAAQILASAGAWDGHVVARAYRDARLMEVIEGSTEICQLMLAEEAVRG